MHEVAIIALDGVFDSALAITRDVLRAGERKAEALLGYRVFTTRSVSIRGARVLTSGGPRFAADGPLSSAQGATTVILPGIGLAEDACLDEFLARRDVRSVGRWLTRWLHERQGAEAVLAAACTSTFILAQAGLLDGRVATTTWWLSDQFRARYPAVELSSDLMVTRDGPIVCAGAAMAHMDLALTLLEGLGGPVLSNSIARQLLLDERETQARYMIPTHRARADDQVMRAELWVRGHLASPIAVEDVAKAAGVSPRTLARRLRSATGESPLRFIQRLRAERALHLIETTSASLERIAAQVGYAEPASLRRLIKRVTGELPSRLR
jgi:transcriptional regulator GlxA family with amidase domain